MKELTRALLEGIRREKLKPAAIKQLGKMKIENVPSFRNSLSAVQKFLPASDIEDVLYSILTSSDPEMAVKKLHAIFQSGKPGLNKEHLADLIRLLGASNFLGNHILKNPEILQDMQRLDFFKNRISSAEHIENLRSAMIEAAKWDEIQSGLLSYKYKQYLRITVLSLRGSIDLTGTTEELSSLADATVSICLGKSTEILARQSDLKEPSRLNFAVIGMGKLGGFELNYSSDIDLMYIYDSSDENFAHKEYYIKLSELLTKMLSEKTPQGFLYRVDLRLRPDGDRGEITQEISNMLRYYEYAGRTWERSIFLRSRFIAGNRRIFDKFIAQMEPFIFKKYLDFGTIEDLREMKSRINREVSQIKPGITDIKNGRGGIREIEFFIHALQLINGGRIPSIRDIHVLSSLEKLHTCGLISQTNTIDLKQAYVFLRKTEHALQIKDELQTWKIPEDETEIRRLALRADPDLALSDDPSGTFKKLLASTRRTVSAIYDSLFGEKPPKEQESQRPALDLFLSDLSPEHLARKLLEMGFKDGDNSLRNFNDLKMLFPGLKFSAKGKRALRKLLPDIIASASATPEPDMALASFIKFALQVRMHASYFTLLKENSSTLKFLMLLFGTSRFLSSFLLKHPELLDYLVLAGSSRKTISTEEMKNSIFENIKCSKSTEESSNTLRRLNNQEILRVALNEMYKSFDTEKAMEELTKIADIFIYFAYILALENVIFKDAALVEVASFEREKDFPFTVIAMGKLGSREFTYKSDLDLIFIYDGRYETFKHEDFSKLAQKIISILSLPTEEGYLYNVDMRLRPSGSRGTLVTSLQSFSEYHSKKSRIWEKQALLRARYVCGNRDIWEGVKEVITETCFSSFNEESISELVKIKNSLEKDIASPNEGKYNLKSGKGGLLDLEFALHILELKYGKDIKDFKAFSITELLDKFLNMKLIEKNTHSKLKSSYNFLKRLEHKIRLIKDRQVSSFTRQPDELHKIAKSFSHEYDGEDILKKYKEYSSIIRSFYLETVGEA